MRYLLAETTWPEVEEYLRHKQTLLLPVGSTEQHGPTGIIGIDYLTSEKMAHAVAEKTQTLVAPTLPFGMALHHMAFPGTISFTPKTYIQVLTEIFASLQKHGFRKILLVNGHGGNIAPITTAFCEFLNSDQTLDLQLINWWHQEEVTSYEKKHFGDLNGFHATVGEISATMYTHPQAYEHRKIEHAEPGPQKTRWPLSPTEFRRHFPDGRMGSQPNLASREHGEKIFNLSVEGITKKLMAMEK